ncbi:MAG: phosphotransferase [Clostridia bacterium]|nr:phosphotransferase [Clostridia bacterium]
MEYNLSNEIASRPTKNIYRDNNYTIKLFVENYPASNILNEALNQTRVQESTDLSIPKLVEVTKINNRWAIVSEHIEGKNLETIMNEEPDKFEEHLNRFVDIQLEILSKHVPLLNRMKEKYKRKINEETSLDPNTKYDLLQRLEGMQYRACLCHGDFQPSNIIIKDDGSYSIIDWAHVTQGNAASDVAMTFLIFSMNGKQDVANRYVDLYCQKANVDKREIQSWIPIVAAAIMSKSSEENKEFLRHWTNVVDYQ